jgi:hypothetical protein
MIKFIAIDDHCIITEIKGKDARLLGRKIETSAGSCWILLEAHIPKIEGLGIKF